MNLFSRSLFFFLLAPSVKQVIDVGSLGGPRGMQGRRNRWDRSGGRSPAHILADQLSLLQHGEKGGDYALHITTRPPAGFSDLPTALGRER